MKFISDVTLPSWPGISVNLNFWQYQSHRNNNKFDSWIVARISIFTLNPSKLSLNKTHI